jgi:hypothetical protein
MTLVVARVTPLGVRLASDMRITDRDATRRGYFHAALKLVALRPTLCIAYAGNAGFALEAIRDVVRHDLGPGEATQYLASRSDQTADFLIASLRPPKLVAIKDSRVQERASAWLGDRDAFAEYQRHYHRERWLPPTQLFGSADHAEDIEVASRMSHAMQAVVHGSYFKTEGGEEFRAAPRGGCHQTVGEAAVAVVPRAEDGLFKYIELTRAEASWQEQPLPTGLGVALPDWGSAERGAFSYSMLTSQQPGVAAIGLYFYEGRLGVLYAPLILDGPEKYAKTTPQAFVELVRLRRGISLMGFIANGPAV